MRPTIFVDPLFDRYSGYGSKVIVCRACAGSTWSVRRTYAVHGFDSGVFFNGGFDRLFEDFLVSSDSRIVRESPPVPRLAQPGWEHSHLGCPRVPSGRRACSLRWGPSHLVSGSSSPSHPRQELLCSAAPEQLLFGLRGLPWGGCFGAHTHTGSLLGYSEQGVLLSGRK